MKAMLRESVVGLFVLGLASGCAGYDEGGGKTPEEVEATAKPEEPKPEEPKPEEPSAADLVEVSVASVQLQDDCAPRAPAQAPAKPSASMSKERSMQQPDEPAGNMEIAPGASAKRGAGFAPSCIQSRVQFAIASGAKETMSFSVKAVRIKKADDGKVVGEMSTREPQIWAESKYDAWDQSVQAGADIKVGYALGGPDWSAVSKAVGGDAWGPMYVLEFDVEIDGELKTIASPKVPRDEPQNIVT